MLARTLMTLVTSIAVFGLTSPATGRSLVADTTPFHLGNDTFDASAAVPAVWAEEAAASGWRPLSLQGCALALGTMIGALATTGPYAPLVASAAFHAALLACF